MAAFACTHLQRVSQVSATRSSGRRCFTPRAVSLPLSRHRRCRRAVTVRASAEPAEKTETDTPSPAAAVGTSGKGPNSLSVAPDTETFQDMLAFTGPIPERLNGRVAMISFVAAVAAEFSSHQGVLEQLQAGWGGVLFLQVLLTLGSVAPKFAAGVSIAELQDSANREGLPPALRFFNKTHEIWVGRVAMLGFAGLVAVEAAKGGALFGGASLW